MKLHKIYCRKCKEEVQHKKISNTDTATKVFLFPILPIVLGLEKIYWQCLKCNNKISDNN